MLRKNRLVRLIESGDILSSRCSITGIPTGGLSLQYIRIIVRFDVDEFFCTGDETDSFNGGSDVIEIDEFETSGEIETDADDGRVDIEFKSMLIGF
jgi:hypothetical protein